MLHPFIPHTERKYCINGFLKILSISSSHTNGHPAVVPMVTALNHVVADGRRAGGLNLSSSILTDYRERERVRGRRRCLPPRSYGFFGEKNQYFGSLGFVVHWYSSVLSGGTRKGNAYMGMTKNPGPLSMKNYIESYIIKKKNSNFNPFCLVFQITPDLIRQHFKWKVCIISKGKYNRFKNMYEYWLE